MTSDATTSAPNWIRSEAIWRNDTETFMPGWVVVEDGRITALPTPGDSPPVDAKVRDLKALHLLPGLINTHVHIEFSGGSDPLTDYLHEDDGAHLMRAIGNARALLESGVTTARDCGSGWATLSLARRPDLAPVTLPRLLLSGPPITPPRGHLNFMHGTVRTDGDIRAHVARLAGEGGQSVKVMASGGSMTPGSDPTLTAFGQQSLNLIAQLARDYGYASVAHVLSSESIRRSARARIDSLEHCAFYVRGVGDRIERNYVADIAGEVRDAGVHVMPNLSTATHVLDRLRAQAERSGDEDHQLRQFDVMLENFERLHALGIPFTCGSDAGVRETHFDETWREIMWTMRAGFSGAEAIRSATTGAARAIGLENEIGSIAPGFAADLIAIEWDPLTSEQAFREPMFVMRDGDVIVQRPGGRS